MAENIYLRQGRYIIDLGLFVCPLVCHQDYSIIMDKFSWTFEGYALAQETN